MATTSIWRVKGYLGKVLLYAENPEKTENPAEIQRPAGGDTNMLEDVISYATRENATEERRYVSGINCDPKNAREQMMTTKRDFGKTDGVIAYHGYQSFREGEVTPELAHQIGMELAEELWGEKYEVIVATHLDKAAHIHNHFVVNTVSFVDGIKYHRTQEDYRRMREVSDRLCREHGLSVVKRPQGRGKHYSEWQAEEEGRPTHRGQIRADIDRAIAASLTSEEFYQRMMEMGYELKFYAKSGKELDRPSLKPRGSERFFRFDRLGEGYSVEEIDNRILDNYRRKDPFPKETRKQVRLYRQEHPKRTKAKGLAALYWYYCYELHIIKKFPASSGKVTAQMQRDLRKLERLDAQTRFLADNHIETNDDLVRCRAGIEERIEVAKAKRQEMRNEMKRYLRAGNNDMATEVQTRIAAESKRLQRLRNEQTLCKNIEERSICQKYYCEVHDEKVTDENDTKFLQNIHESRVLK